MSDRRQATRGARILRLLAAAGLGAILVLVALELALRALGLPRDRARTWDARLVEFSSGIEYYAGQTWGRTLWEETVATQRQRYRPYGIWRRPPHAGETINIDETGMRRTVDASCTGTEPVIWMFGGSTLWGWGSPDAGTIPSALAASLKTRLGEPVCLRNLAENAYVASQSLIALTDRLRGEERPDLVIFYDGINEVSATLEGHAGSHLNREDMENRFERELTLSRVAGRLRLAALPRGEPDPPRGVGPVDEMASATAAAYLATAAVTRGLGRGHGFRVLFFWQPMPETTGKTPTAEEQRVLEAASFFWPISQEGVALRRETTARIRQAAARHDDVVDLSTVLDDMEGHAWADGAGHLTPDANGLVAAAMLERAAAALPAAAQ